MIINCRLALCKLNNIVYELEFAYVVPSVQFSKISWYGYTHILHRIVFINRTCSH